MTLQPHNFAININMLFLTNENPNEDPICTIDGFTLIIVAIYLLQITIKLNIFSVVNAPPLENDFLFSDESKNVRFTF